MPENNFVVRLHIRILKDERGNSCNPTRFSINQMLDGMRAVYGTALVDVIEESRDFIEDKPHLVNLSIGNCRGNNGITREQEELFSVRSGVDETHIKYIFVYFVHTLCRPCSGCSHHPPNKFGVIIAQDAPRWTLAHEIGHVLHVPEESGINNLMIGTHTLDIPAGVTPILSKDQKCRLRIIGEHLGLVTPRHQPIPPPLEDNAPVTMQRVLEILFFDHPDYKQFERLGINALPFLEEIVREGDAHLSPRAVTSAAFIKSQRTIEIFRLAASSQDTKVRLAAACSLQNFGYGEVEDLLPLLLEDKVLGVRKFALRAIPKDVSLQMRTKLEEIINSDPHIYIRQLSEQTLLNLNPL